MTFATPQAEASKARFRFSMLVYDTRYRAITLQVIALVLVLLCLGWLADNVIRNLDAKGKDINFGFLWVRAGYDIEQTLVPYTNDSTHGRAVLVGLLNTLLISALGCALATVVGVTVGVLRLSRNWLVARLATLYVEILRNVPLLLWILLVFVVISETMPAPNDFKITHAILDARLAAEGEALAHPQPIFHRLFSFAGLLWLLITLASAVIGGQIAQARTERTPLARLAWHIVPPLVCAGLALWTLLAGPVTGHGGTEPAARMWLFDTIAITNRGTNLPAPYLTNGFGSAEVLGLTWNLSLMAVLVVFGLSLYLNRRLNAHARAVQEASGTRPKTALLSLGLIVLPTLILCLIMGLHWDVPHFPTNEAGLSQGFNFKGGFQLMHSFTALLIALGLYTSAYIAEIVRAGIMAVPKGQSEAAAALGLRPERTMRLVVLPQALRVIVPPLISQYLNLIKNTSLGIAVSYLDLRGTLGGITLNQTGRELEAMLLMMLIYLTISLLVSAAMNVFNNQIRLKER